MRNGGDFPVADQPRADVEPADLGPLADALGWSGLGEYLSCFDLLAPRRRKWEDHRDDAPAPLRPLIDFFLLNRAVAPSSLPRPVQAQLILLEGLGLLRETGAAVAMANELIILPIFGRWIMCHPPQANPRFYLGDDTVALLSRLTPIAGGRCLDLCAGPGTLALHAAGIADRVIAVERTRETARLARLNASLNRLSHRVEVLEGDLYEPVAGQGFDTVVANPPMLPLPPGLEAPAIGDGGEDGLALTKQLVAGLPLTLLPNGLAQIIGGGLSDGSALLGIRSLEEAAAGRLDLTLSILSHRSLAEGSPYLNALVVTAAAASGADERDVLAAYRAALGKAGATALCHLFIHARLGQGRIDIIDPSAGRPGHCGLGRSRESP